MFVERTSNRRTEDSQRAKRATSAAAMHACCIYRGGENLPRLHDLPLVFAPSSRDALFSVPTDRQFVLFSYGASFRPSLVVVMSSSADSRYTSLNDVYNILQQKLLLFMKCVSKVSRAARCVLCTGTHGSHCCDKRACCVENGDNSDTHGNTQVFTTVEHRG